MCRSVDFHFQNTFMAYIETPTDRFCWIRHEGLSLVVLISNEEWRHLITVHFARPLDSFPPPFAKPDGTVSEWTRAKKIVLRTFLQVARDDGQGFCTFLHHSFRARDSLSKAGCCWPFDKPFTKEGTACANYDARTSQFHNFTLQFALHKPLLFHHSSTIIF